jgi:aryl-alcohol dehydrogenase-like predicted oxidoreductase
MMQAHLQGKATAEQTARWTARFPELAHQLLLGTGLTVSSAGFGSYRVDAGADAHREALRYSLRHGINLIDTSANYADGGSERLIGEVLAELTAGGELTRESVVVVTKAGYLQGENYRLSQERKRQGSPYPELVEYSDRLEHCIHPEFLGEQLDRSLDRLKLESVDVYLLHNPEYYLSDAVKKGVLPEEARREYLRRIEEAFRHLEQEADRGRIGCYGISSNSFPYPAEHPEFTPLDAVWDIAERIGGAGHRFRVIQLPANLLETGAFTERNQRGGFTAIEYLRERGLAVLVNRPLNAYHGHRLHRLADVPPSPPAGAGDVEAALEQLRTLEQERAGSGGPAGAELLAQAWRASAAHAQWMDRLRLRLVPAIQQAMAPLLAAAEEGDALHAWCRAYVSAVNGAIRAVTLHFQALAREEGAALKALAAEADAAWAAAGVGAGAGEPGGELPLSRLAVRALRSSAGVGCVLVGMRSVGYADDVLAELRTQVPAADRAAAWERLREAVAAGGLRRA